ncbi:PREDICTED: kelch domain-containing protein 1-like, partial [Pterocles gutturalis]|uniref:kelch domain-containing protein 1-like n=1 Tax=Pterocles gutturalis TaxID=240206 RepID=UPI000528BC87
MHLMEGELPTSMSGSCGASINGKLYIFGGFDDKGYSNRLYYVNLRTKNGTYRWKKITNFKGQPPTPRDKLSCWVYKDRLIYFGGYGCRKHNELSDCFDVHDAFWEGQIFWGWHNDVHVFDTTTQTWSQPAIRGGDPPQPRAAHTCAVLGNKGYIFGGRVLQTRMNDLHCLNLDTWTWSGRINISGEKPKDRSWHTLTPIGDDRLFLFGGLSSDNVPLSDGWIHSITTNGWKQLTHLPKSRPRWWQGWMIGTGDSGAPGGFQAVQGQIPYWATKWNCHLAVLTESLQCKPPSLLQQKLQRGFLRLTLLNLLGTVLH